ncbi:uncharacterized protein B0J16DRAFT_382036 [Fusarium flagelliforme]|uniref:uncharacterized protein n=1 Tax=Fusarium flagelliforme TaxID=2675880 RepID=UPI001E8CC38C|nr:uncharacterized protein B0J16DRAFT_382036 [Fusarium flagelliforme]KAH7188155.1 hypothetical protein B0J16DRAFT_382036 [Fusarium flagelliforme]
MSIRNATAQASSSAVFITCNERPPHGALLIADVAAYMAVLCNLIAIRAGLPKLYVRRVLGS